MSNAKRRKPKQPTPLFGRERVYGKPMPELEREHFSGGVNESACERNNALIANTSKVFVVGDSVFVRFIGPDYGRF